METKPTIIVVGVDFDPCSDEAILAALERLSADPHVAVHLLHVLDPRDVLDDPEMPVLATEERVLAEAPGVLAERAAALAAGRGLVYDASRLHTHARIGPALATLLQMTVDYRADLLIVGTHGRRGLSRLALGSVAEHLVRDAHCPVLVARRTSYEGLAATVLPDPPSATPHDLHRAPPRDVTDHVTSTESDIWRPSHPAPTGFRIV